MKQRRFGLLPYTHTCRTEASKFYIYLVWFIGGPPIYNITGAPLPLCTAAIVAVGLGYLWRHKWWKRIFKNPLLTCRAEKNQKFTPGHPKQCLLFGGDFRFIFELFLIGGRMMWLSRNDVVLAGKLEIQILKSAYK